jgi:hypothetical protein
MVLGVVVIKKLKIEWLWLFEWMLCLLTDALFTWGKFACMLTFLFSPA